MSKRKKYIITACGDSTVHTKKEMKKICTFELKSKLKNECDAEDRMLNQWFKDLKDTGSGYFYTIFGIRVDIKLQKEK